MRCEDVIGHDVGAYHKNVGFVGGLAICALALGHGQGKADR